MNNAVIVAITAGMIILSGTDTNAQEGPYGNAEFGAAVREYLLENPEVMLEVFAILETTERQAEVAKDASLLAEHAAILLANDQTRLGEKSGPVQIIEFADYRCGYCKANHEILAKWASEAPGRSILIKELPILGEESQLAAETALSIQTLYGQKAYEDFHNLMFSYRGQISPAIVRTFIAAGGYSMEKIELARKSTQVQSVLLQNKRLAQVLGIQGTPSFVIGNAIQRGMVTADDLANATAIRGG